MKKLILSIVLASVSHVTLAADTLQEGVAANAKNEPKTEVAREYVELRKLYSLSPALASTVLDVNMGMANQCGQTMSWQKLFEDTRYRNYASLVRSEPDGRNFHVLDALVEDLCRSLNVTELKLE